MQNRRHFLYRGLSTAAAGLAGASALVGARGSRAAEAPQGLSDVPYRKWRDYDAEDSIRFYALRLHELGMIKATPDKIIAKAADWRFLNEVKQEMGI